MEISINKFVVRFLLFLSQFFPENKFLVVCKGYGEDYELFTQLNWDEDKEFDFIKDTQYCNYQLWVS